MFFWSIIYSITLVGVILGALGLSKLSLKHQENENKKNIKIREIRLELVDIEEIIATLMIYDRNVELIEALIQTMNDKIKEGLQISPKSTILTQELTSIDQFRKKAMFLLRTKKDAQTPTSDSQIVLLKKHFREAFKLIQQLQSDGTLSNAAGNMHIKRLTDNTTLLEVKAYQYYGEKARAEGNENIALNYFKYAKELIGNSELDTSKKTEYMQKLNNALSNLEQKSKT